MLYLPNDDASDPPPVRNGYTVVAWPLSMRLMSGTLLALMLSALAGLVMAGGAPPILWVLAIALNVIAGVSVLYFWRVRNEYNETTIVSYSLTGGPKRFTLSEFANAGAIGVRGHEFETHTGDKIYVNSYQRGAASLIRILQHQVSAN
jgi:membrane protein implicated in regulation of membrane protease activity